MGRRYAKRGVVSILLATVWMAIAAACSSFSADSPAPGAADAEPDTSLDGGSTSDAFQGLDGDLDAAVPDPCRARAISLGAAPDATVFCERFDTDAGVFAAAGPGTRQASSDGQGPFVAIVGDGTYSLEVPASASRALLSLRVRVRRDDGGGPYLNVARLIVTTTTSSTSKTNPYFPRVLIQGSSAEIGAENPAADGGFESSMKLFGSAANWRTYVVRYDLKAGSMSLSTPLSTVDLPFRLQGDVTQLTVQAGAIGGDHEVDLADLLLAHE